MAAFSVPIVAGRENDFRRFIEELTSTRQDEFRDFNSRYGLSVHRTWLESSPNGSYMAVVQLEGPGADTFLEKFPKSDHPFDRWFLEQVSSIHGIDFARTGMRLPELLMDVASP